MPTFQPSRHQVARTALPSGRVYRLAVCSGLYKGEKVERLAEIPPDELGRMGIQGPALVQEEVSNLLGPGAAL